MASRSMPQITPRFTLQQALGVRDSLSRGSFALFDLDLSSSVHCFRFCFSSHLYSSGLSYVLVHESWPTPG